MITSKLPKKTIKFQESCDASVIILNIDKIKSNMQILGRNPMEQVTIQTSTKILSTEIDRITLKNNQKSW